MSQTAIRIDGVVKNFSSLCALDGVSLAVARGEFFGLLGPNGAGKSTLINIIAGLTRADAGSVSVLGHDVVRDYRGSRHAVGIVPQELVFDPFFTVREVLRIQSGYFGLGRENNDWVEYLLEALMLKDKANTNMRALSGGMKRRVLVAQALVHKPEVVVLDEPTAGVDVELRQSLWRFVQELHRAGHTIVLTTHYLEEAEQLCDRIGILKQGRIVALDSKTALMARGIGRRISLRVTAASPIGELPAGIEALVQQRDSHCLLLQLDREQRGIVEVLDQLRAAGVEVADIESEAADLEDVFIELTGGVSPGDSSGRKVGPR